MKVKKIDKMYALKSGKQTKNCTNITLTIYIDLFTALTASSISDYYCI